MDGPLGEKLFAGRNGKLIILLVWIYANLLVVPIYTGLDTEVSTYISPFDILNISQTRRNSFKVGWASLFGGYNLPRPWSISTPGICLPSCREVEDGWAVVS